MILSLSLGSVCFLFFSISFFIVNEASLEKRSQLLLAASIFVVF
jgi:hypothetical protein